MGICSVYRDFIAGRILCDFYFCFGSKFHLVQTVMFQFKRKYQARELEGKMLDHISPKKIRIGSYFPKTDCLD